MTPFTVLTLCMGNICRSPMAERLLVARIAEAAGPAGGELVRVHGAGTGFWHEGRPMQPHAADQVRRRGGDPDSFRARGLTAAYVAASDLVLTATVDQVDFVAAMAPDARPRTFVLGEFGRLARRIDPRTLPPYAPTAPAVAARGRAMVAGADAARTGTAPVPDDEVPDPYGREPDVFAGVADQIERELAALVGLLFGGPQPPVGSAR